MNCPNGHVAPATASFCPTCGVAVTGPPPGSLPVPLPAGRNVVPPTYPAPPVHMPYPPDPHRPMNVVAVVASPRGMYTAAAVINWVVLGLVILGTGGIGLICAAWFIPMTIQMHKGAKSPYKHTALGVCALLFCNLVSGILLLADDGGKPARPPYA